MNYQSFAQHEIGLNPRPGRQPEIGNSFRVVIDVGVITGIPDDDQRLNPDRSKLPGRLFPFQAQASLAFQVSARPVADSVKKMRPSIPIPRKKEAFLFNFATAIFFLSCYYYHNLDSQFNRVRPVVFFLSGLAGNYILCKE